MKKTVPFKKEIAFDTNLAEVTSISLEHNLHVEDKEENKISGEFIVSGEYKIADTSTNVEAFHFELPFDIHLDEHYLLDHVVVEIEDFYYEVVDNHRLVVNIEVGLDKLEEKPLPTLVEEKEEREVVPIPVEVEEEVVPVHQEEVEPIPRATQTEETYATYRIYIVREGDTLESILEKYQVTKEALEDYNDLQEIKIGDKLIIPSEFIQTT